MKKIIENAWLIPMGMANAVLLRDGAELTLVDAGFPDKAKNVFAAIRKLGHQPSDLKHLVFTHAHPDHFGSAAAILRETSADTWMHVEDVSIAESGGPFRYMSPAPGLILRIAYKFFWRPNFKVEPIHIDHHVNNGDVLPVAGGLRAVHTPGHCAGQVSLLWQGSRLLIAGDVATNIFGLDDPLGFEDIEQGRRSQQRIADLEFDAAAFGHGSCIDSGASERVRRKWGRSTNRSGPVVIFFLDNNYLPVENTFMGAALKVVSEPGSAAVLLDPERNALVERLAEPDSAAGLARKLGWSRQIVNYHLRELEKAGLVALVEERRKGNCMERIMRRTAQSYVIDPAVVGTLGVNPNAMADKLSASYLIAVAARTIKEVASMSGPAEASGKVLPTVTLDAVVRFRNAAERNAFVRELTGEMARLIGKYHAADAKDGRTFRITAGSYPIPKSEIEKESKSGNES